MKCKNRPTQTFNLPHTLYKAYFKMDHRFKYIHKIIKLLRGNIGEHLHDMNLGEKFLDMIPKIQSITKNW